MRRLRVRLFIWPTGLVVLFAAELLVFRVSIDPYSSSWHFSVVAVSAVTFTLMSLVLALVLVFGRWSARFFALGFVVGAALENRALKYYATHDLLRLTPGTWTPKGWYPLGVPLQRLFFLRGWGSLAEASITPIFLGMVLSGAVCGVLLLVVCEWLRRAARIKRTEPARGATDGL